MWPQGPPIYRGAQGPTYMGAQGPPFPEKKTSQPQLRFFFLHRGPGPPKKSGAQGPPNFLFKSLRMCTLTLVKTSKLMFVYFSYQC